MILARVSVLAASYLLGSIPFGWILHRILAGSDIRKKGSGNIGATNVARTLGKGLGILVLLLDASKGVFAVLLAGFVLPASGGWEAWAGLAAIVGHSFPVFLKFHGGKGVATALGVFSVLVPKAVLFAVLLFALLLVLFRIVSVGSMAAALVLPFLVGILYREPGLVVAVSIACLLVFFRHWGNLSRLLKGEESRL
jgi:glycerol-3-phosphate acyltransferase PlsY